MRAFRAFLPVAVVLAAGCASLLPPAPPDVQALRDVWSGRRAAFQDVRALADVRVEAPGREDLWPAFTAVFTFTAPETIGISGFTPLGTPLFGYEAEAGRYRFWGPGLEEPVSGRLDGPLADPALRLLTALGHVLDGVLGPETGGEPLRVDRQGRWVVRRPGETVRLTADGGRITGVTVERRSGGTVRLAFSDFRDLGPLDAPHRIEAGLPALDARVRIAVSDWLLDAGADAPGKNAGSANAAQADKVNAEFQGTVPDRTGATKAHQSQQEESASWPYG